MAIRLIVVDDHPLVVEGLKNTFTNDTDIVWCGSAVSAAACLDILTTQPCDVLLLDISLPDQGGIDLCHQLKKRYPTLKIIGLSTFHQGSYIARMMESGASGYLIKNASTDEIKFAIRSVFKGEIYLSQEARQQLEAKQNQEKHQAVLTRRELEVLRLIADGLTNPQIAKQLFVSIDTVDSHRKNLLAKTQCNNTAALVRYAFENGWVGRDNG